MSARDLRGRREAPTLDPSCLGTTLDPARAGAGQGAAEPAPEVVGGWRVDTAVPGSSQARLYEVRSGARRGLLKLYRPGFAPVPGVLLAQRDGEGHHVVPLWDQGTHDGRHYEVYPCYDCVTLRELVEEGRAGEEFARTVLVPQLADALGYLRGRGIVHADLSPDNVLVLGDGAEVLLADFGVALGVPAPGSLVARRGTEGFRPATYELDGLAEIGDGYDYGSLGLVVAYTCLGFSPVAGRSRREAARLLRRGTAFSALPDDLRSLCVALSGPRGGASDGDAVCARFVAGAPGLLAAASASEGPGPRSPAPRPLVVCVDEDDRVVVAATPRELQEGLEGHWEAARELMGSSKLTVFLDALEGGDELVRLVREQATDGPDAQVLCLCAALRRRLDGPGLGPVVWLGRRHEDVLALLADIAVGPPGPADTFLKGELLATYCRLVGLDDTVVGEARRICRAPGGPKAVARAALAAFTGSGPHDELVLDGRVVPDVAALAGWVSRASLEGISELVEGDALRDWLFRRGLDDVYREVDSIR